MYSDGVEVDVVELARVELDPVDELAVMFALPAGATTDDVALSDVDDAADEAEVMFPDASESVVDTDQ